MSEERQYLQHGKALYGRVFKGFVATFNWLVDFCGNLKGDADVNDATGKIVVDRTDPAHPVIRCTGCTGGSGGGGGGGGDSGGDIDWDEGDDGTYVPSDEDILLFGGKDIRIDKDGNKIQISYDPGKEPDPGFSPDVEDDPCAHDPSGGAGGVSPDDGDGGSSGGGAGGYGGDGGVPADGDSHTGDNNCNC